MDRRDGIAAMRVAVLDDARDAVARAATILGPIATPDQPLGPLTTYRVGGHAALLARPRSIADLALVAEAIAASRLPVLIVGRGSNLLVADEGFAGIAVTVADWATAIDLPSDRSPGPVVVTAGGAVALPTLARRTAAAGLTGFEWAVGVPGSIGGAVRMNAGGHGSDIASCLVDVEIVDLDRANPEPAARSVAQLGLRFRGSDLTAAQVVVAARLRLHPGDRHAAEAEIAEIVRWRREHQPGGQNAGSVFVNPVPGRAQRRTADRRSRVAGLADRHGVGLREARQLHPGRRRGTGRRRAGRHGGGASAGRRRARIPAAQRGAPGRIPARGSRA